MRPHSRRSRATCVVHRAALLIIIALLLASGCRPREALEHRVERDLLTRQREALRRELARPAADLDSDVVAVIPARLVEELLRIALPVEATLGERFRILVDSGAVDFTGGLALVHLSASVEAADRDNVSARIHLTGILEVLEIQESGTLATRVEILGWRTQDLRVGALSPPAGRLLDELARRPASDLNQLLSRIEIPVQMLPAIPLPGSTEQEFTIPPAEIPIEARLQAVRVGGGRMWVHIDVAVPEAS
jgi:hypothetical protein